MLDQHQRRARADGRQQAVAQAVGVEQGDEAEDDVVLAHARPCRRSCRPRPPAWPGCGPSPWECRSSRTRRRTGRARPRWVGRAAPAAGATSRSRSAAWATQVPLPASASVAHSATAGASAAVVTMPADVTAGEVAAHLGHGEQRVERDRQRAEPLDREERDDEVEVVGEHDGEGVPRADVPLRQRGRPPLDRLGQLVPGQAPLAVDEGGPAPQRSTVAASVARQARDGRHGSRPATYRLMAPTGPKLSRLMSMSGISMSNGPRARRPG